MLYNKGKNTKALLCCEVTGEITQSPHGKNVKAKIRDKTTTTKMIDKVHLSNNRAHFRITVTNRK